MKALSIKFHALPTSRNITQDYGARLSTITLPGLPDGACITGVFVDGLPQWTVPGVDPCTVSVRPPLLQQGERIEVRCMVPTEASTAPVRSPDWPTPAYPTPSHSYGLQAPESPHRRPLP